MFETPKTPNDEGTTTMPTITLEAAYRQLWLELQWERWVADHYAQPRAIIRDGVDFGL